MRPLPQYCRSDITEASDTRQQFCVILNSIFVDFLFVGIYSIYSFQCFKVTHIKQVYTQSNIMKENFLLKLVLVKSLSWLRSSKSVWKG